ncbi:hypothetical protein Mesau_05942 [Mesorhizobium australicum WSM2073]|uniref:MBL fold metallo-hydrolase n=3 Tax=Mesorhizobium TaxID=68287 RepID=L0KVR8_MESAW|nr:MULTISPECIES: hypothetical protein [Mesorhizobium]ADV14911.1 hypothetical protein Mesci_5898 [Mesorhizobium ciceri biovar biserrulae WSM1271]AEH90797.1 conserved hypothetical protein [Mesorhizobium opportunistum WSM2075]AGB48168.1 hypothetical protein Mesau_05942 [Mesorhizobium australicum WSM2073]OBP84730.1 hypothetical protein BAE40_29700 [Mesorhizobium loti]
MFTLTMNPASEGDALVLAWGDEDHSYHALVDLGRTKDYGTARPALKEMSNCELFVISHIDADHIEGAMPLVREAAAPFNPKEVWFNAYHHLVEARDRITAGLETEPLNAEQGEKLSSGIDKFNWKWNSRFASRIASRGSPEASGEISFAGLAIRLLSPNDADLAALIPRWMDELEANGLRPFDPDHGMGEPGSDREPLSGLDVEQLASKRFKEDTAAPNRSSIAFIAEFGGRRVLLGADAHPGIMERALRELGASEAEPYPLACFKVSHHGSKANTSPEILRILDCTAFAFSTDGSRHNHPDPETIARILVNDPVRQKVLYFNYAQENTTIWNDPETMRRFNYHCVFPAQGEQGLVISI